MSYKHISFLLSTILLWTAVIARAQVVPSVVTLGPSQTQQFSTAVNAQTTWAVEPAELGGSITPTGLYTAPASYTTSVAYVYALSGGVSSLAQVNLSKTAVVTSGTSSLPSTRVSISVSPSSIYVWGGQSKQFDATVTGTTHRKVVWAIVQGAGTISPNGLYTAPSWVDADSLVTISATSVAFPSETASATITLGPAVTPAAVPLTPVTTAVSISLKPKSPVLQANQSKQFNANVTGTSYTAVTWSINPPVGSVVNGLYTAPATISTQQVVLITATSVADTTKSATQGIILVPPSGPAPAPPAPVVNPAAVSLSSVGTQQFSVLNLPSGASVTWSISPLKGSITQNGVYTAPNGIAVQKAVTVTATNSSTQAVLGTANVNLVASPATQSAAPPPPAPTSVSPAAPTMAPAAIQVFTVQNLPTGTNVAWSISPTTGSITQGGSYTAPASVATPQTVYVFATNASNLTQLGVAKITFQASPAGTIVSPATATVAPGWAQSFSVNNLLSGTTVAWSVSPATGSITPAGSYTAPASVATQQTITVTAKNASTSAVLGTAAVTLLASPSVSPATATVAPAGTQAFLVKNLPSATTVAWSVNPPTGSITQGGSYTAPASVATQQTITVTASNASTSAVLGTATLTLQASPTTPTVSPATVSVSPAGSQVFSVQNLPSGTTVTWAINPATGSISAAGKYTAPASVAAQKTITVKATNASTAAVLGTATLTLLASSSVSPATATVAPSGSQQFSVQNLPSGTVVMWGISPSTGSITQSGAYTAPSTVATQTTITVTATNASTAAVLGTAVFTLQASPAAAPTPTTLTLPIEVVGPNGTTSSATFAMPQGANLSGQLKLWMQIHNLKYDTEASVQVNNSAWLPISSARVTLLGNAAAFGGIGGGFHTLQMTLNLPAGVVTSGTNTITFRFNASDSVTSGYRVLAFNIQSAGSNLLPASMFVNDDPNSWQPPSTASSDIAAGLALYQGASLTAPGAGAIKAHCSDCHTEDGRDLKYFNYSNGSIEARSAFHGLTAQQGAQIASYIRTLNVPNPGRPWNPPYQPGPGLDSQPVANWSAGAGIDAVLDNDSEMLPYLAPGGSTTLWSATSYLNAREIPTSMQLLDWNSWLPVVHPMDAFGAAFTSSQLNTALPAIRSGLRPNSPAAYQAALEPLEYWLEDRNTFLTPYSPSDLPVQVYSVAQWQIVKMWELNQEFGLEGMPQVPYGAKADARGWFAGVAFSTSPNILHIPVAPGIGNGTAIANSYLSLAWYHLQLVQNDGQGTQSGHGPIDYGYVLGFVRAVMGQEALLPGIMEQLEFQIKDLQEVTLAGTGPQLGPLGWHATNTSPANFLEQPMMSLWSATSPAEQTTLMQAYTQAWFDQASQYTPQQYYQGGWATAAENPATDGWSTTFGGQLWYMLPRLRYFGVSNTLTDQISAWAATLFPLGNWTLNNQASCNPVAGPCLSGM